MASTSRSVLGALRLAAPRSSTRPFTTSSARRLADSTSPSPDADPDVVESPSRAQPRSSRTPSQEELASDPLETDSLPSKAVPSQQGLFTNPSKAASTTTGSAPTRFDDFSLSSFPHWLERPHPILDAVDRSSVPISRDAPWGSSVSIYNDEKHFKPRPPSAATIALESSADAPEVENEEGGPGGKKRGGGARSNQTKAADAEAVAGITPLSQLAVANLHRQVLQVRRVVRQSGKGKISSMASLIVVGDGKGLVGFGHGKAENANIAIKKAFRDAVRNMDYVPRFEARTIQRSVTGEWGATKVHLRPRPPGFGLRCPPSVHVLASSAGISDLSASITGSTNPTNVCRAVCSALYGGANPVGLGNGIGGQARRSDLGQGAKTIQDLEMERGRRLREVVV